MIAQKFLSRWQLCTMKHTIHAFLPHRYFAGRCGEPRFGLEGAESQWEDGIRRDSQLTQPWAPQQISFPLTRFSAQPARSALWDALAQGFSACCRWRAAGSYGAFGVNGLDSQGRDCQMESESKTNLDKRPPPAAVPSTPAHHLPQVEPRNPVFSMRCTCCNLTTVTHVTIRRSCRQP